MAQTVGSSSAFHVSKTGESVALSFGQNLQKFAFKSTGSPMICECRAHCFIDLPKAQTALLDTADEAKVAGKKWGLLKSGPGVSYVRHAVGSSAVLLHRFLTDCPKGKVVDHINGDRMDNRRKNLRICTHSQNLQNSKPRIKGQYKGVSKNTNSNTYRASITKDYKDIHLGCFKTALEAARAYDAAAVKIHGEFARLNFKAPRPLLCTKGAAE